MQQTEREYAKALFVLAVEEDKNEAFLKELLNIEALIEENEGYLDFLRSPAVSLEERTNALDEAFSENFSETVVSFIKVLMSSGNMGLFRETVREYEKMTMELFREIPASVYSAAELSESQKQAVLEKLEKLSGKKVKPEYIIDSSLIGGIKLMLDGKTYDGSIKGRLQELKDVISE